MHICPDSASEGVYVARPAVYDSCARLTTNPKYLSYMSLFYPYDMWSRSAELNDLTDDAIRLLMFLRQSTLSPMLLAQGVLLYEKMIIWVAKDAVRRNFVMIGAGYMLLNHVIIERPGCIVGISRCWG